MEHALAYPALENGSIDATDLYATDAEIQYYSLRILRDDLQHFPEYYGVLLYRADLATRAPEVVEAILQLEGRLPPATMIAMNAQAKPRSGPRMSEERVAAQYLRDNAFFRRVVEDAGVSVPDEEGFFGRLLRHTLEHMFLVAVSLAAALVIALPLGILAARRPALAPSILSAAGIIQTIPSLALLVFIMALLHLVPALPGGQRLPVLGTLPAVIALFLYSLLPIIRNTYTGLHDIPLPVRESAEALGLPASARLRLIELPMAARSILGPPQ
jgi:osmoprotectant transport system permease protein